MKKIWKDIFIVWRNELIVIKQDLGVLIFLFLLPFAYPLVYSAIYNPEIARDVPVVVVDDSRTDLTRRYVRHLDASQDVRVVGYAANMQEARRAMAEKVCYGVIHLPKDFSGRVGRGESATVELYCDMSLLLRYKSMLMAVTEVANEMGASIQAKRVAELMNEEYIGASGKPIPFKLVPIGNVSQGLASAIMPGVLMLILQQCIILAICFLGVTSRERAKRVGGKDTLEIEGVGALSMILGKSLCYFMLMIVPTIFVVHFVPLIFDFPMNGDVVDIAIFMLPYLLAVIFFGMLIQRFIPDRESTFLVFVFTSIVFIFLSGISWPRYAMSEFWQLVGSCIPSTWGVTGFVGINTVGATLEQQSTPYIMLWILSGVYLMISYILFKKKKHH